MCRNIQSMITSSKLQRCAVLKNALWNHFKSFPATVWLAFVSPPLSTTQNNSTEAQSWNTRKGEERVNAKLYWNLKLHWNWKFPHRPDVPTEFFSSASTYYKKEIFIMQCSQHYNLLGLRTITYGASSLKFNIQSSATRLTAVHCSPSLILNQHDSIHLFLPRHWCLLSITITISNASLQLGMLRACRRC